MSMEADGGGGVNEQQESGAGKNKVCGRQSSTRWTPTSEQIRILKDLYYNNGVRSPTAEQIQRISANLRQYGKIEGKNVFYWFQNHKARERQKKRFTAAAPPDIPHRPPPPPLPPSWKIHDHHIYNNFSNTGSFNSSSSTSSPGVLTHVSNYGYGSSSIAMEKSFRDCSISPNGNGGGSMGQNYVWIGVDAYPSSPPYPFLEKRKCYTPNYGAAEQTLELEQDEEEDPEIETLPLFPVHGDNVKHESDYFGGWHRHSDDSSAQPGFRASLELSLNSYAARFPASP